MRRVAALEANASLLLSRSKSKLSDTVRKNKLRSKSDDFSFASFSVEILHRNRSNPCKKLSTVSPESNCQFSSTILFLESPQTTSNHEGTHTWSLRQRSGRESAERPHRSVRSARLESERTAKRAHQRVSLSLRQRMSRICCNLLS